MDKLAGGVVLCVTVYASIRMAMALRHTAKVAAESSRLASASAEEAKPENPA